MKDSLRPRLREITHALATKIALLTVIFLVVPIVFYRLFQITDAQQRELLERATVQKGQLITLALEPHLESFFETLPEELQRMLDDISSDGTNVKVFMRLNSRVGPGAFFYIAASPALSLEELESERRSLIDTGIFGRLATTCDTRTDLMMRFDSPGGGAELLTSMTPVHAGDNCWVVLTSQSADSVHSAAIVQPIWQTTTIRVAALIYILSVIMVIWLFSDMWRSIDRFRLAARKIRTQGGGQASFRQMNTIPELVGVADDFDALVAALKESKDFIIEASEANAHALKAPLAVIAQAVEPLKRAIPKGDVPAQRSIDLIESSVARLDLLVSAARDIEQGAAEVIYPAVRRLNLSDYLPPLLQPFENKLVTQGRRLVLDLERGVYAYATEEALETIVENLVENAASFTPRGGTIHIGLSKSDSRVTLTVADNGPGVSETDLPHIFERYFSNRAAEAHDESNGNRLQNNHYGLGLWIVRRNVEGLGGSISARNRGTGGLIVTIGLRAHA